MKLLQGISQSKESEFVEFWEFTDIFHPSVIYTGQLKRTAA